MFIFEKFPVHIKSEEAYKNLSDILSNKQIDLRVRDQLRRALLSITLNIAEGTGKFNEKEKKNFYVIARGSVNECVAVLRLLKIESRISDDRYEKTYLDFIEIGKMLSGLINRFS